MAVNSANDDDKPTVKTNKQRLQAKFPKPAAAVSLYPVATEEIDAIDDGLTTLEGSTDDNITKLHDATDDNMPKSVVDQEAKIASPNNKAGNGGKGGKKKRKSVTILVADKEEPLSDPLLTQLKSKERWSRIRVAFAEAKSKYNELDEWCQQTTLLRRRLHRRRESVIYGNNVADWIRLKRQQDGRSSESGSSFAGSFNSAEQPGGSAISEEEALFLRTGGSVLNGKKSSPEGSTSSSSGHLSHSSLPENKNLSSGGTVLPQLETQPRSQSLDRNPRTNHREAPLLKLPDIVQLAYHRHRKTIKREDKS